MDEFRSFKLNYYSNFYLNLNTKEALNVFQHNSQKKFFSLFWSLSFSKLDFYVAGVFFKACFVYLLLMSGRSPFSLGAHRLTIYFLYRGGGQWI